MNRSPAYLWVTAILLWIGVVGATGVIPQRELDLAMPLHSVVPTEMLGYRGVDVEISPQEQSIAGFTDYLMKSYEAPVPDGEEGAPASAVPFFTVYVGYYAGQTQGKTIHSPRNCLPGAGWEALESEVVPLETATGVALVNRYLLQNGRDQALVLYWYQGRGRIQASEYAVKWDLLRDAALTQRSDEALVRIVVPLIGSEEDSFNLARSVAERLVPALDQALPD